MNGRVLCQHVASPVKVSAKASVSRFLPCQSDLCVSGASAIILRTRSSLVRMAMATFCTAGDASGKRGARLGYSGLIVKQYAISVLTL